MSVKRLVRFGEVRKMRNSKSQRVPDLCSTLSSGTVLTFGVRWAKAITLVLACRVWNVTESSPGRLETQHHFPYACLKRQLPALSPRDGQRISKPLDGRTGPRDNPAPPRTTSEKFNFCEDILTISYTLRRTACKGLPTHGGVCHVV